ncbi:RelA/SpoT family protein [Desulfosoma caldarium]|uniref:GTP pyrophosphokinase n=1 Tax=Desulfosoma caldarium TaxID=610254 RepID=A0A3N1UVK1_9BACT|nr:HD domain-containing protein [Desulfosoma caldarium]ROQ93439.1 GTP pyrophosphokinase [Desulfosoma caldarium]
MYQHLLAEEPGQFDVGLYRLRMEELLPHDNPANALFYRALEYALVLHEGQIRKSGAPYISHPCAVAYILAKEMRIRDPEMLAAAILHDVIEDVPSIDYEVIEQAFGTTVADLVEGCTKMTRLHQDRAVLKDLTHSKILQTASQRLGVLIVKLADRLHNLRTLHYLPKPKRQRIAQETVEIYAPLAAKLNIFPLKRELYHLSLSYLYPKKSKKILNALRSLYSHASVLEITERLKEAFARRSMDVILRSRVKGLGTYYDAAKGTLRLANAENRVDFTVVLPSNDVDACYCALGVVNTSLTPVPRSLRDFIANPKNNGYMSLHTRIHYKGENYLVKVRTAAMDEWATYGVLSQWNNPERISEAYLKEISEFLRSVGEYGGPAPQRRNLIQLSEAEEVTVYTPHGDAHTFPLGSIVLDFAFKIHSDLGNHCVGGIIGGRRVPPTHKLKDGDTVRVLKVDTAVRFDPDLERLCMTPKARNAISKEIARRRRNCAHDIGRDLLLQELAQHGWTQKALEREEVPLILEVLNVKSLEDLFVMIGQDLLSPHAFLYYLQDVPKKSMGKARPRPEEDEPIHERKVLKVNDLDPAVHKFAGCCHPYPGERHVLATLSERGVTFHRSQCSDVTERHGLPPHKLLDVQWDEALPWRSPVAMWVRVLSSDKQALLPLLGKIPLGIEVRRLEGQFRKDLPQWAAFQVILESFKDARHLFGRFPSGAVIVERYTSLDAALDLED